jgi:hypothetical protein
MLLIVHVYCSLNFKLTIEGMESCLFEIIRVLDVFCSENDHLETYSMFLRTI